MTDEAPTTSREQQWSPPRWRPGWSHIADLPSSRSTNSRESDHTCHGTDEELGTWYWFGGRAKTVEIETCEGAVQCMRLQRVVLLLVVNTAFAILRTRGVCTLRSLGRSSHLHRQQNHIMQCTASSSFSSSTSDYTDLLIDPTDAGIREAADLIKNGKVVAFPTEVFHTTSIVISSPLHSSSPSLLLLTTL